jgi:hypothetical protein
LIPRALGVTTPSNDPYFCQIPCQSPCRRELAARCRPLAEPIAGVCRLGRPAKADGVRRCVHGPSCLTANFQGYNQFGISVNRQRVDDARPASIVMSNLRRRSEKNVERAYLHWRQV